MEKLRNGKFICKYLEYGASHLALVGNTETEAYQKLLTHLMGKKKVDDGPEPPEAA